MSTNGIKPQVRKKRPSVASKVIDYKQYCRAMWIRRQKGKRRHGKEK